jgi:addiction module RelB/DinJ family antitoxin
MALTMSRDTRVQFRIDSAVKDGAFAVFNEMGITPSEAIRVFFMQVQKTRSLPFSVIADEAAVEDVEPGYNEWLKERLANAIRRIDSGEVAMHSTEQARAHVRNRIEERRAASRIPV